MNTSYFELTVTPSAHPELFTDLINEIFPDPVEELKESFILRSSEDEFEDIIWAISAFSDALSEQLNQKIEVDFKQEEKENVDWIQKYQDGVEPIAVGEFYIHPSWHPPMDGKKNILIDPALAFGSGHHPTTATCLKAIDSYVKKDSTVVDVGCGSGILSIASAMKEARVDLCDTDEDSVSSSKSNFEKNGVKYVNIWQGSIGDAPQTYDIIIANIVADVLTFIANDIFKKLRDDGTVILSGILDKYEEKVIQSYRKFTILERIPEDEWITLVMKKKEINE
jgi:ribosomal protein L11 methyltransferase